MESPSPSKSVQCWKYISPPTQYPCKAQKSFTFCQSSSCHSPPTPALPLPVVSTAVSREKLEPKWRQNFAILILYLLGWVESAITWGILYHGTTGQLRWGWGEEGQTRLFIYCSWLLVTFAAIRTLRYGERHQNNNIDKSGQTKFGWTPLGSFYNPRWQLRESSSTWF